MNALAARSHCADAGEWEARCELAALYRLIAHFRMTDIIDTHLSLRLPGTEHFLINRYGVLFEHMRASDLIKIDSQGRIIEADADPLEVNAAGFTIHSAVHMARPDVRCVIHTHTSAGIAVSALKAGLLPISQHALKFYERLGYHAFEGMALDLDERERLVADLGTHNAMILRNHGLLAMGASVPEAFYQIYFLERACQAQVQAMSGGLELNIPSPEVCRRTLGQWESEEAMDYVKKTWAAALRLIEAQQTEYCS